MSRVLVTGATGFVGAAAVDALLAQGHEVVAVSRRPAVRHDLTSLRADLLEPGAARAVVQEAEATHLVHLAWEATPGQYLHSPLNAAWQRASLELYEAFVAAGGARALMAGTCFEYDLASSAAVGALAEDAPLSHATPYAAAKNALARSVLADARARGVGLAWARLFYLYGPGEPPGKLVAATIRALLRGEPALCGDGTQVRDYLHVEDVAAALAATLGSGVVGPVNVGSGAPMRVAELVSAIGDAVGRPELVRLGARPSPTHDPSRVVADVRRLLDEVGWRPKYDLGAGLSRTIAWWRAELARQAPAAEGARAAGRLP